MNLHSYLKGNKGKGFRESDVIMIFSKLCRVLRFLNQDKYIIHRNLKPTNIVFDSHKEPKVVDYGMHKIFDKCLRSDAKEDFIFS